MTEVRGLAKTTVVKNSNEAPRFLSSLDGRANVGTLRNLSVAEIDDTCGADVRTASSDTDGICIYMRSFLGYLHSDAWISLPRLARRSITAKKVIISGDELDATCNRVDARGYEAAGRTREADRTNRSRNGTVATVRIDRPPNGGDRSESEGP